MSRIARFLVAHTRAVLAVTVLITIAALAMLPRVSFNVDVTSFLTESNEEGRAFAALKERYDARDPITVLLEREDGGSFRDREGLRLLTLAREALQELDEVARVGSFLPESLPLLGTELTSETVAALPTPALRLLSNGPASELLLDEAGTATLLIVLPSGDEIAVARAVRAAALPDGLMATYAGMPIVFAEVWGLLSWFLLAIPPVVLLLLVVVFTATLGHPRLAVLALIPALLGSLWTFGALFAFGVSVDLVTVIVPIFVIVMGSADGLHFVAHLQDGTLAGLDPTAAVRRALDEVGVPMILTTVTTAAGFLSLLATGVEPIQQLGSFVALGIVLAGVISFFALPSLMVRMNVPTARRRLGARLEGVVVAASRRRWVALALALPAILFAAFAAPRLEVDADPLVFFPSGHPLREAFAQVSVAFGGATPMFGEFVFDPEKPTGPQLETLRARSRELEMLPGIRTVLSLADLLPRVPESQRQALLDGSSQLPFGSMASADGLRFVVLPGEYQASDVAAWRAAAASMPEVRVLSGSPMLLEAASAQIARAQASSLLVAFVLVAAMLALVYRRLGRALLALAPITVTVAVVLGFLAASRIHLNLVTVVASSIVLGVGIDYAIHLIAAMEHAHRSDSSPGWVSRAIRVATRPIVANAVGIAVGLSALQASPLAPHHQISALMWVAMLTAALTTLTFLPAASPREGRFEGR